MHKSSPLDTILRHFSTFHNFTTGSCNTFYATHEISRLATLDVSACILNPTASVRGTYFFFQNFKLDCCSVLLQNWNYTLPCEPTDRAQVPFKYGKNSTLTGRRSILISSWTSTHWRWKSKQNFIHFFLLQLSHYFCLNVPHNIWCD